MRLIDKFVTDLDCEEGEAQGIINAPFRTGKSTVGTVFFLAWHMLWNPQDKLVVTGYGDQLVLPWSTQVRDLIREYGPLVNVRHRRDTFAKRYWEIQDYGGSFQAVSRQSALMGKGFKIAVIDDLIKDAAEAMSEQHSEANWAWFLSTFASRRDPDSKVLINQIRWGRRDITGRVLEHAKQNGQTWKRLTIPAVAEENDVLGRKPGELLWPAGSNRHTRQALDVANVKNTRWYMPCYQQRPEDVQNAHFIPQAIGKTPGWPNYGDIGDGYSLKDREGTARKIFPKCDVMIFTTVDWAWSQKATADYSAIETFGLTPDGRLLILDVVNRRVKLDQLAAEIANVCKQFKPSFVAVESGHPSLNDDCRRYKAIPEIRWLNPESRDKLRRALPAIIMGSNGKILLPTFAEWMDEFVTQVKFFTGIDDDHDDMVDALSYGCQLAQSLKPTIGTTAGVPEVFTPGKARLG